MAVVIPFLLFLFFSLVYSNIESAKLKVSNQRVKIGRNVTLECVSPPYYTGNYFASIKFRLEHGGEELFPNEDADLIKGDHSYKKYTVEISSLQDGGIYTCIITPSDIEKTVSADTELFITNDTDESNSASADSSDKVTEIVIPIMVSVAGLVVVVLFVVISICLCKKYRRGCFQDSFRQEGGPKDLRMERNFVDQETDKDKKECAGLLDSKLQANGGTEMEEKKLETGKVEKKELEWQNNSQQEANGEAIGLVVEGNDDDKTAIKVIDTEHDTSKAKLLSS